MKVNVDINIPEVITKVRIQVIINNAKNVVEKKRSQKLFQNKMT